MFRNKQVRNRWHDKTALERTLIICVSISILAILALVFVLIFTFTHKQTYEFECRTPACLAAASRILRQLDVEQNPCQNFVAFACSNEQKANNLLEEEDRLIELLYKKQSRDDDPFLLTTQRELYKACVNQTAFEDSFKVVNGVLASLGGWHVVQGHFWKETNFDWLGMSYKLRQLGYHHDIFLGLNLVSDAYRDDEYMFQVAIPTVEQIGSLDFDHRDPVGFLTDVAIAFGAETHIALNEMSDVYQLVQDLRWLQSRHTQQNRTPRRVTVAQFQHEYGNINWLQYINRIAGSSAKISEKDHVLFPPEEELDDWFELLSRTPKRIQANYMLWRVINEHIQYLAQELQKRGVKPTLKTEPVQTRSQFCIQEVEKRFVPSPIRLEYVRNIVTTKKKNLAVRILQEFKVEMVRIMTLLEWKDDSYKQTVLDTVHELVVIVGMPDAAVLEGPKLTIVSGSFLLMLAQATKNHWSNTYNLINKPVRSYGFWMGYKNIPFVLRTRSELSLMIPAYLLQDEVFAEDQVPMVNYAHLGVSLGPTFLQMLLEFEGATGDLSEQLHCGNLSGGLLGHYLGLRLSYSAYQRVSAELSQERLIGVNYTSDQVFWIAVGQQLCNQDDRNVPLLLREYLPNDVQLLGDFNCPNNDLKEVCRL